MSRSIPEKKPFSGMAWEVLLLLGSGFHRLPEEGEVRGKVGQGKGVGPILDYSPDERRARRRE